MTKQERLKAAAVIFTAAAEGKQIQWEQDDVGWTNVDPFGDEDYGNVRKHPECYRIKPEPNKRWWSKPEDVPPMCWIGRRDGKSIPCRGAMVISVCEDGIIAWTGGQFGKVGFFSWKSISEQEGHYSTDRKNWSPCTITEEAQ